MPSANKPGDMKQIAGPGPEAKNRLGSFIGPMAASFQVATPDAPTVGDLETAELYGLHVAEISVQFAPGQDRLT